MSGFNQAWERYIWPAGLTLILLSWALHFGVTAEHGWFGRLCTGTIFISIAYRIWKARPCL